MKCEEIEKRKEKTRNNYKLELIEAKRKIILSKYNIINPIEIHKDTSKHHRL